MRIFVLLPCVILLLFNSCQMMTRHRSVCDNLYARIESMLVQAEVSYVESYGYGVGLTDIDKAELHSLSECIPCFMKNRSLMDINLLKAHLALTLHAEGEIALDEYKVMDEVSTDSLQYTLNNLIWIRSSSDISSVRIINKLSIIEEWTAGLDTLEVCKQ